MPVEVFDSHRNEGGEQVTARTVEVTDATGETTAYEFEQAAPLDEDDWKYVGDDNPSDTAWEAVRDGPTGGENDG
jgi:hypothetical protein